MRRNSLAVSCLFGILVACGTASAGSTYGTDYKMLSGAQCQPSWGNQWADFVVNPTGIRNMSESNRYVSCTLVLDGDVGVDQADADTATSDGPMTLGIGFDYSQVPATGTFTTDCTIFNHLYTGSMTTHAVSVSSARTATTVYNLWAPTILNGLNANNGAISFNCRLPSKVKLVWVYSSEASSTGGYSYVPDI